MHGHSHHTCMSSYMQSMHNAGGDNSVRRAIPPRMTLREGGLDRSSKHQGSSIGPKENMAKRQVRQDMEHEMRMFNLRDGEVVEGEPMDSRRKAVLKGNMDVRASEGVVERLRKEKKVLWKELVHAQKDVHWTKLGVSRQGAGVSGLDVASAEGDVRTRYFRLHDKREETWQAKETWRKAVRRLRAAEVAERAGGHALDIKRCERAIEVMREEIKMHRSALKDEVDEEVGWKHGHSASPEAQTERAKCVESVKNQYGVDVDEGS